MAGEPDEPVSDEESAEPSAKKARTVSQDSAASSHHADELVVFISACLVETAFKLHAPGTTGHDAAQRVAQDVGHADECQTVAATCVLPALASSYGIGQPSTARIQGRPNAYGYTEKRLKRKMQTKHSQKPKNRSLHSTQHRKITVLSSPQSTSRKYVPPKTKITPQNPKPPQNHQMYITLRYTL